MNYISRLLLLQLTNLVEDSNQINNLCGIIYINYNKFPFIAVLLSGQKTPDRKQYYEFLY